MLTRRALVTGFVALLLVGGSLATLALGTLATEPTKGPVVPDTESGALPLRAVANERAAAWDADAYLTRLTATEGPTLHGAVDPPFLWDTSHDAFTGNGRALAWTFAYAAPERPGVLFLVSVGGDESVLYARELPDPERGCCYAMPVSHSESPESSPDPAYNYQPPAPPKLDFSVDAPEAVAAVLDRPEFANFSADHPVFQALLALRGGDGEAVWHVVYRTSGWFSAEAAVDAKTGEVHHVTSWPRVAPPEPPCCEPKPVPPEPPCCDSWQPEDFRGEYSAVLTPSRSYASFQIPIESRAHAKELRIDAHVADGMEPVENFAFIVRDGDWREVARERTTDFEYALTEFGSDGWYHLEVIADGPLLGDRIVDVVIDVAYGPAEPIAPMPTTQTFVGETFAFGSEAWYSLRFDRPADGVRVTLEWERTVPTDNLELALLDRHGNQVAHEKGETVDAGGNSVTIETKLAPDEWCCLSAAVRAAHLGYSTVPFTLTVEWLGVDDPEVVALAHESHDH